MSPIRDNVQRAKQAQIFGLVYAIILFVSIIARIVQVYQTQSYRNATGINVYIDNPNIILAVSCVIIIGFIITFIRWFRRAYYNLHLVNPDATFFKEGWAAGAWFVPFTNLIRPYRIMREIWMGTLQVLHDTVNINYPKTLLKLWWATFITSITIAIWYSSSFMTWENESVEYIESQYKWNLISDVLWFISLITVLIIIRKFSKLEQRLKEAVRQPSDSIFAVNVPSYNNEQSAN